MIDQETLQAIGKMMDQKLAVQKAEITHETQTMLAAQKTEITHETQTMLAAQKAEITLETQAMMAVQKDAITHETQLMMENYFGPKFDLLAENQQLIMEKLKGLDDLEVMDTRITALEAMVKKINRELKELKQAQ